MGNGGENASSRCGGFALASRRDRAKVRRCVKALRHLVLVLTVAAVAVISSARAADEGETRTMWNGFDRLDFKVEGRASVLLLPKTPAPGRPWIWRMDDFDSEPQVDLALLARGWHVAYMDVKGLYGAPRAIALMGSYYAHALAFFDLSKRVVLEGFGVGGLAAFNFAVAHPTRVAALSLDAPVLDIRSWPGRDRSSKAWVECLAAYNFSETSAAAYKAGPLDRIEVVARAGIPIIAVCSQADTEVSFAENAAVLAKRYRELNGDIQMILKPGAEPLPHGLKDPMPVVDFLLKRALF